MGCRQARSREHSVVRGSLSSNRCEVMQTGSTMMANHATIPKLAGLWKQVLKVLLCNVIHRGAANTAP